MMARYFVTGLLISLTATSVSWSLPAPKYLSVPHWQRCTHTVTKGMAKFICLPSKKPIRCPRTSWQELADQHLIEECETNS